MFPDDESYCASNALVFFLREKVAELYQCSENIVQFFECDQRTCVQVQHPSAQRPRANLGDGDLHGGQQFVPLMDIEVPEAVSFKNLLKKFAVLENPP